MGPCLGRRASRMLRGRACDAGHTTVESPAMIPLLALLVAPCVAAQTPARTPGPPAARRDTTAAPKDSLTRFLESFSYRGLGPAAYSGRVTAIAVPPTGAPRSEEHTSELQSPTNL